MTAPRCPETGQSCATAYNHGCRCIPCKAYNTARSEARRRKVGMGVQLRKRRDAVLCPVTGQSPPTSFRDGCRCGTCRRYVRDKSRRQRAQVRLAEGKILTDTQLVTLYSELWKEAEAAMTEDPEYLIRMAEDAAHAFELEQDPNSVSANAA